MIKLSSLLFRNFTQTSTDKSIVNAKSEASIPHAESADSANKSVLPEQASIFSVYQQLPNELKLEVHNWLPNVIHEEFKTVYASVKVKNEAISQIIPEAQRNLWGKISSAVRANRHPQQDSELSPSNASLISEIASFSNNEKLLEGLAYPVLGDLTQSKNALSQLPNEKKALSLLDDLLQSDKLSCQKKQHLLNNLAYITLSEPYSAKVRSQVSTRIDALHANCQIKYSKASAAIAVLSQTGASFVNFDLNPTPPIINDLQSRIQLILHHKGISPNNNQVSIKNKLNQLISNTQSGNPNQSHTNTIQIDGIDQLVMYAHKDETNTLHFRLQLPVAETEGGTQEDQHSIEFTKRTTIAESIAESVRIRKNIADDVRPLLLSSKLNTIWLDNAGGTASLALIDSILMMEKNPDVRAKALTHLLTFVKERDGHGTHLAIDSKLVDLIEKFTKKVDHGSQTLVGNHDADLILDLIDAMVYMRAAKLQDSWETGVELLSTEKKRTDTLDPQMRAYKVLKRYLSNASQDPTKVEKIITAIWEGDALDKMSASGRRIQTSHWKKGVTSIAVTGGIYGLTHALFPAIELGLGIDLKLAAAKEKLNLDLNVIEKIKNQLSDTMHHRQDLTIALGTDNDLIGYVQQDIRQRAELIPNDSTVNEFLKNNTEVHVVNGHFVLHDTDNLTGKIPSAGGAENQAGNTSINSLDNLASHIKARGFGQDPSDIGSMGDFPKPNNNYVDYDKLMQCLDKSDPSHLSAADQETIANLKRSLHQLSGAQANYTKTLDQINGLDTAINDLYANQRTYNAEISNDNDVVSKLQQTKLGLQTAGTYLHTQGVTAELIAIGNEKSKNKIFDGFFRAGSKTHQELKTWGPVGIRNIAKASYKAIDEEVLSSPREALRRLTPEILRESRAEQVRQAEQNMQSEQVMQAARAVEVAQNALDLEIKFAIETEQAMPAVHKAQTKKVTLAKQVLETAMEAQRKQQELTARFDSLKIIAGTWQAVLKNLHTKDLSLDRKAETLHECIKELDQSRVLPIHHKFWEASRENAINAADRQMLIDALPKLQSHPASYVWLAQYLMRSAPSTNASETNRAPLSQQTTKNIESTLRKYASPLGSLQRSQLRTKAIKVGHTIAPAWLRPDFGIFGGQQGRRDRTSAIEAERAARLTNRQSKVEKIAAAAQKLQATMPTEQGKNSAKSVVERLKPAVPAPHEEETGTDQAI